MAGQYNSLAEVRNSALFRADLEGILDRHPTLNVNFETNMAYRRLRLKLANMDVTQVMTPTAILTLPTTEAVAGAGYSEIPWPQAFTSVHGLDVKVGGQWGRLPRGEFVQRRLTPYNDQRSDYRYADDAGAIWVPRTLPTASGATVSDGVIMLFPVPESGQYILWGLTQWSDITVDTDVFPAQEGWIDWVIYDLGATLLIRDIGPQTSAQLEHLVACRERVWNEIKPSTTKLTNDGPMNIPSRYGSARGRGYRMVP
ncbi:MAG: hypothetical protein ABW217_22430 [Polyangiaceae bacterium]